MRTTVILSDDVCIRAKKLAAESGKTLSQVIEDALRESFHRREITGPATRFQVATFTGDGLQPGVDLDDAASLEDLMGGAGDSD